MQQPLTTPVGMVDTLEPTPRQDDALEHVAIELGLHASPAPPASPPPHDPATQQAPAATEAEQSANDWPKLGWYRGENAACLARGGARVVFIGDSITEFWPLADPALFSNGIVGRGIGGQTTQQHLLRFYADVVSLGPAAVHILGGINDIAGNTGPTTPQDYRNNILAMLDLARHNGIAVMLGSILPATRFSWQPEVRPAPWIARLNDWLRDIARQRGALFVDYHAAMAAPDHSMRAGFSNDGLHPNAAMRPLALSAIAQALQRKPMPRR